MIAIHLVDAVDAADPCGRHDLLSRLTVTMFQILPMRRQEREDAAAHTQMPTNAFVSKTPDPRAPHSARTRSPKLTAALRAARRLFSGPQWPHLATTPTTPERREGIPATHPRPESPHRSFVQNPYEHDTR